MTPEMPRYRCHKEVQALKIAEVFIPDPPEFDGARLRFEDDRFPSLDVPDDYVAKHDPKPGGYLVVYADGYQSFSPAEAFESGYTLIGCPCDPREWDGGEIPPVCDSFHPHPMSANLCANCTHSRACHEVAGQ